MGLSPSARGGSSAEEMTGTGQAMGTADYMAPEQASDSRTVDIRADVYSLGCTLYKLLSGRAPFGGPEYRTSLDKMNAHVDQLPPPVRQFVSEVPEKLAAILARMLAKDPDDRFATPGEVADALAPWCAGADLPALLARAISSPLPPAVLSREGEGQGEGLGFRNGRSARRPAAKPPILLTSRSWRRFAGQLIALTMVGGIGFAMGIIITIKRNGTETKVEVPSGSTTKISVDGNVDVTLGEKSPAEKTAADQDKSQAANPAADLKALQGRWNVVRVEKGKDSDLAKIICLDAQEKTAKAVRIEPADIYRIDFSDPNVFLGPDPRKWPPGTVPYLKCLTYRIDPTASPKTIDIIQLVNTQAATGVDNYVLSAVGIYRIDGDKLVIAMRPFQSTVASDQRPKGFSVAADSGDILFVLERHRPSGDEKAIPGDWTIVSKTEDGRPISQAEVRDETYHFYDYKSMYIGASDTPQRLSYDLNSAKQPKEITIGWGNTMGGGMGGMGVGMGGMGGGLDGGLGAIGADGVIVNGIYGIYKIEGDRLTMAFGKGYSRPERFESKPGSGVELLVLERRKAPADPNAEERKSGTNQTPPVEGNKNNPEAGAGKTESRAPPPETQMKVFTIVNGDAISLASMVQALLPNNDTPGQAKLLAGEEMLKPIRLSVDKRTNSIIATGDRETLAIVAALLERLDQQIAPSTHAPRGKPPRVSSGTEVQVPERSKAQVTGGDDYLFGGDSISTPTLQEMQEAFGKAGLNGFAIEGGRVKVPHAQRAAYLAALADAKALPPKGPPVPPAPPVVTVCHPVVRDVTDHKDFTGGIILAAQTAEIRARVTGNLEKVHISSGMAVKQGELLMEIDPKLYQAELDQASNFVKQAKARLEFRDREYHRATGLFQTKAIGQGDFDQAKSQRAEAEAALQAAEAALNVARLRLEYTRIVAPFAGRIGSPVLDAGNLVTADKTVLATISSTDPVHVDFRVEENFLLSIRGKADGKQDSMLSLPVLCRVPDGKGFVHPANMYSVGSRVLPDGTVSCRAVLANKEGVFMPGMRADVRLMKGTTHKALLVPASTLGPSGLSDRSTLRLFLVNDQNVVTPPHGPFTIVDEIDGMLVVEGGLKADDWVVISDKSSVREGMIVKPEKAATPSSPPTPAGKADAPK